jgi:hypothetical protein
MIGRTEGPVPAVVEEWADDDTAREFVELAELEELDPRATPAERWSVAAACEVLLDPARRLDLLAELEAGGEWPLRLAEAEETEDRVARSLEGLERGAFDALAPYRAAEGPDDDTGREAEGIA